VRSQLTQRNPRSRWAVGLDLGQSLDPSAVAVVERRQWWRVNLAVTHEHRPAEVEYRVRHLERLQLGTPYPAQARHVRALLAARGELAGAALVVDATGVGRPVLDLFRAAGLAPAGVTLTGGEGWSRDGAFYRVGKLPLVSRLQALMHGGELKVAANLAEAPALRAELQDYRVDFSATGHASFNAASGRHDDLLIAAALACWWLAEGIGGRRQVVPLRGL
jgi:hypothetical protein